MAEIGVHRIGEVHRRGSLGEVDHLALRRQHIDGVGEKAAPEGIQPGGCTGRRVLPLQHLPQPCDAVLEGRIAPLEARPALLVPPVGGNAELGVLVHLERADLHLERLALRAVHGGMERAVVVRFRLGDVIVELARQRRPKVMHDAQCRVAVLHVVDQDAHGADVVHRIEPRLLAAHLAPDAVDVLRPSGDLGADARRGELPGERRHDVLDVTLPIEPPLVELSGDRLVYLRLEDAQGKILELPLELPDAQPVGERREEIEHLARRRLLHRDVARAREVAKGLGALGELDHHHAHVLDHREQHLAQPLRLRRALRRIAAVGSGAHVFHACDAGDERVHFRTEALDEFAGVEAGCCGQAQKQRGADARRIELQGGEDDRAAESPVEQRLAVTRPRARTALACMGEGVLQQPDFGGRVELAQARQPCGNALPAVVFRVGMKDGNHGEPVGCDSRHGRRKGRRAPSSRLYGAAAFASAGDSALRRQGEGMRWPHRLALPARAGWKTPAARQCAAAATTSASARAWRSASPASLASTITRSTGSVPEGRSSTRPLCPSAAIVSAWAARMRSLPFQS